jgi:SAM-dependent methyltransferase
MTMTFEPRFGHAAEQFRRYRPGYPAELFGRILTFLPERHRDRAMDLGAGTGRATAGLVGRFAEVIAVEADGGMVDKIAEQFPSVTIRRTSAEECAQAPESVDLVTIANALHWMDSPRVLANVHSWLRRGAILAIISPRPPIATPEVDEIVAAEIGGNWDPYRDHHVRRDVSWKDLVSGVGGFRILEQTTIVQVIPTSPRDYTGFWSSTSYGSAYARTLDDPELYWRSLESRIAAVTAGANFPVDFSPALLVARKL